MPQSLSSKLKEMLSVENDMQITLDEINLIALTMPTTESELAKLIPETVISSHGGKILDATNNHARKLARFGDCRDEFNTFIRGGVPGMARLNLVYKNILKEFDMEQESKDILHVCKLYIHNETNCLKRRRSEAYE